MLASYSKLDDKFYTVCKVGTGFSFDDLRVLTKELKQVDKCPDNFVIQSSQTPEIYFEPSLVFEVSADSFSKSPFYFIKSTPFSLRFPRFIKI